MIEARNITVIRGDKLLLDDVSLSLAPGRLTAIVGPNGAGKSTFLRVLSGEMKPNSGDVFLDGKRLADVPATLLAGRRAVVPQTSNLSFPFTVIEVVMLGATVPAFHLTDSKALKAASAALEAVGLDDFANRFYGSLSGGERQRAHLARALCQLSAGSRLDAGPQALLLDEPTASLDLKYQREALTRVRREVDDGRAALLIIHDLNLACAIADEVVLMAAGRIVLKGPPERVAKDDVLSGVYGLPIRVARDAQSGQLLIVPRAPG